MTRVDVLEKKVVMTSEECEKEMKSKIETSKNHEKFQGDRVLNEPSQKRDRDYVQ